MDEFFGVFLSELTAGFQKIGREIADEAKVPYLADLERDGPRGPRDEGKDETGMWSRPGPFLPGSANNGPDCCRDVPKALEVFGDDVLVGIYAHVPSMNLVLVGASGKKVGVRAIDIKRHRAMLIEGLRQRASCPS